jgi:hypothetical protein
MQAPDITEVLRASSAGLLISMFGVVRIGSFVSGRGQQTGPVLRIQGPEAKLKFRVLDIKKSKYVYIKCYL